MRTAGAVSVSFTRKGEGHGKQEKPLSLQRTPKRGICHSWPHEADGGSNDLRGDARRGILPLPLRSNESPCDSVELKKTAGGYINPPAVVFMRLGFFICWDEVIQFFFCTFLANIITVVADSAFIGRKLFAAYWASVLFGHNNTS